jgi:hypothetical protein
VRSDGIFNDGSSSCIMPWSRGNADYGVV